QVEVFVVGGCLREVSLAMVGRLAHQALKGIYFDLAFLGVNGISIEHGLTIPSLEEAETAATIMGRSRRTIVVTDHTKFGNIAHGKIADITDIDVIITDSELDPGFVKSLSKLDVEINTVMV
ncbi:DeoR/GlpR transcriptional regulator, partial [Candidatus Bipolaricaulota bacterium]|nr:DeoR/GlpR transcriptional regulator [Candidatus Bipolaricaulota bacterium]